MRRAQLLRLFWIGAAAILVVAALVALAAVVSGSFDSTDGKILASLGTLLLAGAVATVGASLREARRAPGVGAILAVATPVLGLVAVAAIWNDFDSSPLARAAGSSYVLLATGLLVGTARVLVGDRTTLLPLFFVNCGLAVLGATLSVIAILAGDASAGYGKLVAAVWILAVLAYLLIPVGRRLSAAPATTTTEGPRRIDLDAGAETGGTHVRIVSGVDAPLRHETIALVLDGRARAGSMELAAGDAVVVPAGTAFAVEPNGHTLLVGRS
jgi:hypothetical protein